MFEASTTRALFLLAGLAASALGWPTATAQEPAESAAGRLLRDAWWKEIGPGALDEALRGYLAAADAAGPPALRARARLRAGIVQQHMGRTDDAVGSWRRVIADFPDQTAVVAEARSRLQACEAELLVQDYPAWRRRHLFSREEQVRLLELIGKIKGPGSETSAERRAVLAYGEAAVPALTAICRSRHDPQRELATKLLLELGTVPPVQALFDSDDWAPSAERWAPLLRLDAEHRRALAVAAGAHPGDLGGILAAVALGPAAAAQCLATDIGGVLASAHKEAAAALLRALHHTGDPALQAQVVALADDPAPLAVRLCAEKIVTECGLPSASPAAWLAWGIDRLDVDARLASIGQAARLLRRGDGDSLDRVLDWIESLDRDYRGGYFDAFGYGLMKNGVPLQIPWNRERLLRCYRLVVETGDGVLFAVAKTRFTASGRKLLLDSLFTDPAAVLAMVEPWQGPFVRENLCDGMSGSYEAVVERAWNADVARELHDRWRGWTGPQRLAACRLIARGGVLWTDAGFPAAVAEALKGFRASADAETAKVIDEILPDDH